MCVASRAAASGWERLTSLAQRRTSLLVGRSDTRKGAAVGGRRPRPQERPAGGAELQGRSRGASGLGLWEAHVHACSARHARQRSTVRLAHDDPVLGWVKRRRVAIGWPAPVPDWEWSGPCTVPVTRLGWYDAGQLVALGCVRQASARQLSVACDRASQCAVPLCSYARPCSTAVVLGLNRAQVSSAQLCATGQTERDSAKKRWLPWTPWALWLWLWLPPSRLPRPSPPKHVKCSLHAASLQTLHFPSLFSSCSSTARQALAPCLNRALLRPASQLHSR